jgi:type 1 glutamine amidotransferase
VAQSSERKALIVWGGWDGHEPQQVAEIFERELKAKGFQVEMSDTLDAYTDGEKLKQLSLIVPVWTMASITGEQLNPLLEAVKSGVGLAGCHGGMCDSFRNETEYQFMTGGQWVSHPGNDGTEYTVRITDPNHFITQGAPAEFAVKSEQYYMHVDPANKTLAVTKFPVADGPHVANGEFDMPVIWTKYYGQGRVAYNSLGHHADIVEQTEILPLMVRGMLWAAHAEDAA